MLLADFQSFVGHSFLIFLIMIAVAVHFFKKFISGNETIKTAAKDIATQKAVGLLQRFFK